MALELSLVLVVLSVVLFYCVKAQPSPSPSPSRHPSPHPSPHPQPHPQPQVPCYFIFGDSLVDSGNNNRLSSLARANYPPYGIDFPPGPTGRFSNGKTSVDVVAELVGFKSSIPPYANTRRGRDALKGVNYASASAGIREETGKQLGARISFSWQVRNFKKTVKQIVRILGGKDAAANYLEQCIYSVTIGSNDYLNNYFMPKFYSSSRRYTPDQYAQLLIQQYFQQLQTMYNNGARKFVLFGVGQIGCIPNALSSSPDGRTCNRTHNSGSQMFNNRLIALVDQLNTNLPDATFIYIDVYGIFQDIIQNPSLLGFRVTNAGCCRIERNTGLCLPQQTPCRNRTEYLFWDAYHPTEAGNTVFGRRAYTAQRASDAHPIDISHLTQLHL